jgi:hypothetical protein
LSAEAHLLASLPSDARAPDMLGITGVMKLFALATGPTEAKRATLA